MNTKNLKSYALISVLLLTFSCRINGNFKGLYSYYNKSKKSNPDLFVIPDKAKSICNLTKPNIPKVYIINGMNLKKCFQNKKDIILYIWGPNCKSKICYPLEILQRECDENDIELYIVAEYYDAELMEIIYNIQNPIFGIDIEYYNSNLTSKYLTEFIQDLTGTNDISNKFYYFKNGAFQNSFESIENSIEYVTGKITTKSIYEPSIHQ